MMRIIASAHATSLIQELHMTKQIRNYPRLSGLINDNTLPTFGQDPRAGVASARVCYISTFPFMPISSHVSPAPNLCHSDPDFNVCGIAHQSQHERIGSALAAQATTPRIIPRSKSMPTARARDASLSCRPASSTQSLPVSTD